MFVSSQPWWHQWQCFSKNPSGVSLPLSAPTPHAAGEQVEETAAGCGKGKPLSSPSFSSTHSHMEKGYVGPMCRCTHCTDAPRTLQGRVPNRAALSMRQPETGVWINAVGGVRNRLTPSLSLCLLPFPGCCPTQFSGLRKQPWLQITSHWCRVPPSTMPHQYGEVT